MPKVVPITKRLNLTQAHDYVSAKHRVDFDHKSWWKSVGWFWMGIGAFMLLIAVVDYATACGELESEEVKINTVIRI